MQPILNVRVNSQYYVNSAPAEAQTTNLHHRSQASQQSASEPHLHHRSQTAQQSADEPPPLVLPANDVSTTHKEAHKEQNSINPPVNPRPETECLPPVAIAGGEREPALKATAKAFVSYCESDTMLIARVLIAGYTYLKT
jgi:hypothetical protein